MSTSAALGFFSEVCQCSQPEVLTKYGPGLIKGVVGSATASTPPPAASQTVAKKPAGDSSRTYGDLIPFGDPSWYASSLAMARRAQRKEA